MMRNIQPAAFAGVVRYEFLMQIRRLALWAGAVLATLAPVAIIYLPGALLIMIWSGWRRWPGASCGPFRAG
jgi:hypothetical protein